MKILHYALGFPPERSGGLVKYSLSLIAEQINSGHDVKLVYPGRFNITKKEPYFKSGIRQGIPFAELMNALPLPLIGNIKTPADFMMPANIDLFLAFLSTEKPDVIHLHTLMGLYSEFLTAAKQLNIKVVFTTHDFFGISPNPKFYLDGHDFVDDTEYDIWNNIREYGSTTKKLRLVQLSIYPSLRKWLKKLKKSTISNGNYGERLDWHSVKDTEFQDLKHYYLGMLQDIDVVHFNSQVSKQVYRQFLPEMTWEEHVIPLTSENINNGEVQLKKNNINTIAYIGPYTEEKGFIDFIKLAKEFLKVDDDRRVILMGDDVPVSLDNITNFGKYNREQMSQYLDQVDLVILPSRWHETFGLIALEVLASGTKVVVSSKMGVKDILPNNCPTISNKVLNYRNISHQSYKVNMINMKDHTQEIMLLYLKYS